MENNNEIIEKIEMLISEKKYQYIKTILNDMNIHDIALIIEELPEKENIRIFELLNKDIAADVFSCLDTDIQTNIISSLSDKKAVDIINEMSADDATDLIDEMPANIVNRLLSKVDPETRRDINTLLKYPDNSAGSVMTVEYFDFKSDLTVSEAISKIKKEYDEKETIDTCFVTDDKRKLIGRVTLKDLVINNENKKISEIMDYDVIYVNTHTDQEELANAIKEYDLTSIPVVDSEEKLVGIVTIDDIVDIIDEEATEDIEKMAAILPSEKSYLKQSVFEIFKNRIFWLLLLMISATFTGKIIQHYEVALSSYVILTSFIPMLMNTSGNAGGQSSVTVIRSLSLNDVEFSDIFKIIWKELRVSIIISIVLGLCNFARLIFIDKVDFNIAGVVCITLALIVIIAKMIGCTLPVIAKKAGFDPAVMASPLMATVLDALTLTVYFKIATLILPI